MERSGGDMMLMLATVEWCGWDGVSNETTQPIRKLVYIYNTLAKKIFLDENDKKIFFFRRQLLQI